MPTIPALSSLSSRQKWLALGCGATALVLVACVCVSLNPWLRIFLRGQPYPWANAMSLQSVSMVSASEGWAVGFISGKPNALLMHYQHGQWTILPKPTGLDDYSEFGNVAMVSASDGWALASIQIPLGDRYHSFRPGGVFLHYDGAVWKPATPVMPIAIGHNASALLMLSAHDGWATGEDKTFHYDGTAWREVTALTDRNLGGGSAISATGPNDVWIAQLGGEIIHFDGETWTSQRLVDPLGEPLGSGITLRGIAMVSPVEGWAVGGIGNSSQGVVLQCVGGRWQVQSIVNQLLYGITMRSATGGWAVGGSGGMFRYAGGHWTLVSSPVTHALYSVTISSPDDVWAVGLGGVLLRYHGGAWQQETNVVWSKAASDEWS